MTNRSLLRWKAAAHYLGTGLSGWTAASVITPLTLHAEQEETRVTFNIRGARLKDHARPCAAQPVGDWVTDFYSGRVKAAPLRRYCHCRLAQRKK
ncbi:hypothetical protein [Cupriavidus sp. SK-3]|uniref:hypothetical protein n=1 Tax=Cupriavidus sp. SK-3 TaxID=1470558 RepID=UPI0012692DC6|nr:hypothetical protein [Cupriavidus sp. SK-3]